MPGISRIAVNDNLQFLARQQHSPEAGFPEITDTESGGQERILQMVLDGGYDLLILDNFSTLGPRCKKCLRRSDSSLVLGSKFCRRRTG